MASNWGRRLANPDLRAVDGAVRAEYRAEADAAASDALDDWRHRRTLADIAVEIVHRGDRVAVILPHARFLGTAEAVGADLLGLRTISGRVDIHISSGVPLMMQIGERVRDGGAREVATDGDFRGALLARERLGEVTVGSTLLDEPIDGTLVVGQDHVCLVGRGGGETYLPLGTVAYVMPRRD
jgi:hypothetical protein